MHNAFEHCFRLPASMGTVFSPQCPQKRDMLCHSSNALAWANVKTNIQFKSRIQDWLNWNGTWASWNLSENKIGFSCWAKRPLILRKLLYNWHIDFLYYYYCCCCCCCYYYYYYYYYYYFSFGWCSGISIDLNEINIMQISKRVKKNILFEWVDHISIAAYWCKL